MAGGLLSTINDAYQQYIGQPFVRSAPGQMAAGFLGVPSQGTSPDAYKTGEGLGMLPGLNAPKGAFQVAVKAAANAPEIVDAGKTGLGLIFGSNALKHGVKASDAITAERLMKNGMTEKELFQQSKGMFQGPDGLWRRMTSDLAYEKPFVDTIRQLERSNNLNGDFSLGQLYTNKELFEAYPDLSKIKVTFDWNMQSNKHGSYSPSTKTLRLNPNSKPTDMYETLIHEIQHGIQTKEKWQQGGNPFSMLPPNVQRATGHAEAAKAKILDRVTDVSKRHGIPRDDIINATRFVALSKAGIDTTPQMKDAHARLSGIVGADDLKEVIKDYASYGDIQAKTAKHTEAAFGDYKKLQGEAEAREVERQLQSERGRPGLNAPSGKYDNMYFGSLLKRGDTSSQGVDIDWKANPLMINELLNDSIR
jgi:hypothetical protein